MSRDVAESGDRPAEKFSISLEILNAGVECYKLFNPDNEEVEALVYCILHNAKKIYEERPS